jgi:predicted Zn-dependent protease
VDSDLRDAAGPAGDLYLARSGDADVLAPMMAGRIASLEAMLNRGQDSALLRFSLGNEYLGANEYIPATEHLRRAVELDPEYSAAWKLLGRALTAQSAIAEAIDAYRRGIEIAAANGDRQAAKEMTVFLRRLEKGATS